MKIGFVQPEEETSEKQEVGFIQTVLRRDNAEMSWPAWAIMVLLHFYIVQAIIKFAKELFNFFFSR